MDRNLISQRQIDALKLEALRAYFDSRRGRGPAHRRGRGERSCEVPVRTVREWFADNSNGDLLDEIVPLWPNIGSARQFASDHVQEALQTMVELMRSGKNEKVRMDAAATLLALAGVRPTDGAVEEKPAQGEAQRPAVLLNLFLGGGSEPVRVVEGEARPVGKPVRLASETIRAIAEPGSDQ